MGDHDCSLVLGDFGVDGWRMAPTVINLSLEHILLAGMFSFAVLLEWLVGRSVGRWMDGQL